MPCHYSCLTCSDGTSSGCSSCPNNRTMSSNKCICANGYYDDGVQVTCLVCLPTCLTCITGVLSGCTSCQSLYFRQLNPSPTGTCVCKSGYYETGALTCPACYF